MIQYVYDKYGRERAAQVANVITYRPRSALREMAKAVGLSPGHADALTKWIDRWGTGPASRSRACSATTGRPVPKLALDLAEQVLDFPRHLGIHSGGMVMADRPLTECCPVEWARMEDRSVLQWDKDDCAAAGLVKFDLLGLGMLTMLHLAVDLVREHEGVDVDLATIPQEPEVYALLSAADTIGVFQVESRAQMATLPRLRPEKFYDLVVEVALIRPGPIQGGSVHPYLRRRNGQEEVTYPHPLLEQCLEKTLGVPLFQEQLMQMAIDVAGFTPGESDRLRQAMGSKRSRARMAAMRDRLLVGHGRARHHRRGRRRHRAQDRGLRRLRLPREPLGELRLPRVRELVDQAALPGRVRVRAAQRAADGVLLTAHHRARRHPSRGRGARSVRAGVAQATARWSRAPRPRARSADPGRAGTPTRRSTPCASGSGTCAGSRDALLDRIDDARAEQPFTDLADFTRRTGAPTDALEALATAGAFACFDHSRREALWAAGALRDARARQAARAWSPGPRRRRSRGCTRWRRSPPISGPPGCRRRAIPPSWCAAELAARGIVTAEALRELPDRTVVDIAGVVTHRQQPSTSKGVIFLNLEDETGLINVICTPDVWKRFRKVARTAPALEIRGLLERYQGVINVLARRIVALPLGLTDLLQLPRLPLSVCRPAVSRRRRRCSSRTPTCGTARR